MMDSLNHQELKRLIESKGGPHLSIFLPGPPRPNETRQDATRLANLLRENRKTLVQHWMPESQADEMLSPVQGLCTDSEFLSGRRHGVAIFRSPDTFKTYAIEQPLLEKSVIGRTFQVRAILPQIQRSSYHILTLSQNSVALLVGAGAAITEVDVPRLPKSFSFESANVTADRGAQVHSSGQAAFGKQAGVFHGQGGQRDSEKSELREYLRRVNDAVTTYLQAHEGLLILAGVDNLTSLYRSLSSFPRICELTISGNVDHTNFVDLHEKASMVMAEEWDRHRKKAAEQIREQREKLVASDPEQILSAAHEGRIDTLFFDRNAELFGSFYPDSKTMKETRQQPSGDPADPNCDLVDIAVVQTLLHRGIVHSVTENEMPLDAKMAASLRY